MARNDLQPYPLPTTIKITQEDIDFGIRQDSFGCAIAHAIMRQNPEAIRVRVNRKKIGWSDAVDFNRYIYDTPETVNRRLIEPFDLGKPVQPMQFTLRNGQFRAVQETDDHRRRQREAQRAAKLAKVAAGEDPYAPTAHFVQASGHHTYERYVPTESDL